MSASAARVRPAHLAAAPGDGPGRRARAVALRLLGCVAAAVLLEAGTLLGARTRSPLVPGDWNLRRLAVFFCLALLVCLAAHLLRTGDSAAGRLARARSALRSLDRRHALRRGAVALGVPAAATLLARLAAALLGAPWDGRLAAVAALPALAVTLCVLLHARIRRDLAWGFLVVSLSFGALMCACMPVVAEVSWDGQIHFDRTVALSYVLDAEYTPADQLMTSATAVDQLGIVRTGSTAGVWNPSNDAASAARVAGELLRLGEGDALVCAGTSSFGSGSWVTAASVGYLPAAAGLWVGRLLHLPCLGQYLLARLASTGLYCLVFFCAVRRLSSGKALVAAIGLLPTPLLMAANFSYDPWSLALITYALARYVGALQDGRPIGRADAVAIYGAFVLGALVRAVLFPLALVFLVAPARAFADRRRARLFRLGAVACALALLVSFALPFLISGAGGDDARGGSGVDSAAQVAFILSDPLGYLGILAGFAASFLAPANATSILNAFSGFPYLVSDPARVAGVAVAEWAVLLACAVCDRDARDDAYAGWPTKLGAIVGSVGAFALVSTALYVSFTAVGSPTVEGVQYRYLLPILVVLLVVGCNLRSLRVPRRAWMPLAFVAVELALMLVTTFNVFVLSFA